MKQKIKLKDITEEQYTVYREKCNERLCRECLFSRVECDLKWDNCWIKNKEFFSDKFLNQEVEIELPELLTKKEKDYLEGVIKPFKDKVITISKRSFNINLEYISIMLKEDFRVNFPNFVKNNYYKNMEVCREYTLKELGLTQSKYKITLTEFWKSEEVLNIHCDTQEKADKLLKAIKKVDKENKFSSASSKYFNIYKENTVYDNRGFYADTKFCQENKQAIYEFEDVDLEN